MDTRVCGDDQAPEAAPVRGGGEDAVVVVVSGEGAASEAGAASTTAVAGDGVVEASASVDLTGERGRRRDDEAPTTAAAVAEEEASAPPAVVVAGAGDGDDDEDGYVTPTSPRQRLQPPTVCPPAPKAARSAATRLPARRFEGALVMAASASPPGRKRVQANPDSESDEVVVAFIRSLRQRLLPPEDEKKNPM